MAKPRAGTRGGIGALVFLVIMILWIGIGVIGRAGQLVDMDQQLLFFGISLPWLVVVLIHLLGAILSLSGGAKADGERADSPAVEGTGPGGRADDFDPLSGRNLEAAVIRCLAGCRALLPGRGFDLLDLDGDTDAG